MLPTTRAPSINDTEPLLPLTLAEASSIGVPAQTAVRVNSVSLDLHTSQPPTTPRNLDDGRCVKAAACWMSAGCIAGVASTTLLTLACVYKTSPWLVLPLWLATIFSWGCCITPIAKGRN